MSYIKICGLTRIEDVEAVNKYKPDFAGFVFAGSRRQISVEKAKELKKSISSDIKVVGVFVNEDNEEIIWLLNEGIIDIAQLHGDENEGDIEYIKYMTGREVIKAVSVRCKEDVLKWQNSITDYLLLDNGAGGSGMCFDWNEIPSVSKRFFLAGGINASNIDKALSMNPYAIDLSGGVETNGYKDPDKIMYIVEKVRKYV